MVTHSIRSYRLPGRSVLSVGCENVPNGGRLPNTVAFVDHRMENSHPGCFGVRASSLDFAVEKIKAGKMPAFRDRLEAYPAVAQESVMATVLGRLPKVGEQPK